jgi:hypothetical protein
MSVIEQGRSTKTLDFTKLILLGSGPFRTLHYSIIASDLQLVCSTQQVQPAPCCCSQLFRSAPVGCVLLLYSEDMQPILLSVFLLGSIVCKEKMCFGSN